MTEKELLTIIAKIGHSAKKDGSDPSYRWAVETYKLIQARTPDAPW